MPDDIFSPTNIIVGGLVVAVIAGVVVAVYELTSPTALACDNPASPCGAAISPLVAELNQCASNYNSASASFLTEDSCATGVVGCVPTAFTAPQQSYLAAQLTCINDLAPQILTASKTFNQNPLDTLAYYLGLSALVGIPTYLVARAYFRYRANRTQSVFTAYDWGQANFNATIEALVDVGQINTVEAGAQWSAAASTYNTNAVANTNQALIQYANLQLIDQATQVEISQQQADLLSLDFDTLVTVLP